MASFGSLARRQRVIRRRRCGRYDLPSYGNAYSYGIVGAAAAGGAVAGGRAAPEPEPDHAARRAEKWTLE